MSELEIALRQWRQEMAATGLRPEILAELEEHLREDVERQVAAGTSLSAAISVARQRIGTPATLRREYELSGELGFVETLRRHGGKLLLCSAAGLLAAVLLHFIRPAPYQSEATMFVRYVAGDGDGSTRYPGRPNTLKTDAEWANVMQQQLAILESDELARRVAEQVGPARIVRKAEGSAGLALAAAQIQQGLGVSASTLSSNIRVSFRHPDAKLAQAVLGAVIDCFLRMHVEMFRGPDGPAVAVGQVTNIHVIKAPSPPWFDFGAAFRLYGLVVSIGLLAGITWVLIARRNEAGLKLAR